MDLRTEIRKFIVENFMPEKDFGDEELLLESGIIDSTGIIELVAFIETTYGIIVEDEELVPENLNSVEKIIDYLNRKLALCGFSESGRVVEHA